MSEEQQQRTKAEIDAAVAKLKAEALKVEAEAKKALAEARKAEIEADEQACELSAAKIAAAKIGEAREKELLGDKYMHVYQFNGEVNEGRVQKAIEELTYWDRKDPGCEMTLVFNSPGGSVIDGMALFDFITYLRGQGHKITTLCIGYAASMAGILLQAGDCRQMTKESYVLIHEISFGAIGSMGKVEDQVEFGHKIQKRVVDIFVNRSMMTKAFFKKNWTRKDWWLDSDECLKLGIVDEVV